LRIRAVIEVDDDQASRWFRFTPLPLSKVSELHLICWRVTQAVTTRPWSEEEVTEPMTPQV